MLYGYPLDGVVLTTGCDKTTPACIMAAATVNIPAIVLSGGPMLNGWWKGERAGSGTVVWKAREDLAAGQIDYEEFIDIVAVVGAVGRPLQHHGHGLDHERARRGARHVAAGLRRDPGALSRARRRSPTRPAGARSRSCARTCKPSDILTREAFENAIVANSAIGGSTNAPIHINAIARHIGVKLDDRGLGERSATTCRCSSTCSRPATISARNITAPAACRR